MVISCVYVDLYTTRLICINIKLKEIEIMKKQNVGFAFLLLGLIFAVRQDLIAGAGIALGIIGLIVIIKDSLENK